MIKENTLFILGAGASVPYGFPTGKQLRYKICKEFPEDYMTLLGYNELAHPEKFSSDAFQNAQDFADTFFKSSTPSIDLFLARNQKYSEIGKKAISLNIWNAESKSKFREDVDEKQDWYTYLYQRMTETFTESNDYNRLIQNEISFITFNYDRSLEYFLYESIVNSFTSIPRTRPPRGDIFPFSIHHVYGQLAKLPWQNEYNLDYRSKLSLRIFNSIYDNIKVVYERTNDNIGKIREEISKGKRIFFLGFGFAKENLEVLNIPEIFTGEQQIYGTAFGMTEREMAIVKKTLGENFKIGVSGIANPIIEDMNCYELLRECL